MKKHNAAPIALIVLFCGFLAFFVLATLLAPRETFSEKEKRVLASMPELTADSVLDGTFESGFEGWLSDHIAFRDTLVGVNAVYEQVSGRNGLSGVVLTKDRRLLAAPDPYDEAAVRKKCETINAFARTTGLPTQLMLIPTNGYMHEDQLPALHARYHDGDAVRVVRETLDPGIEFLWPEEAFRAQGDAELYYRTDHHYTSRGAYEACSLFAQSLGMTLPGTEAFDIQSVGGFYGSMYAKAGLWNIPPDTIELWRGPAGANVNVSFDDREPSDTMFFESHLDSMDKYPVFMDGNHALVTIETGRDGDTLLLIRDSFGHCFAPFAAECFSKIILADLRYYRLPLSDLAQREGVDRVLVLYGMDTFLTDTNFAWLK